MPTTGDATLESPAYYVEHDWRPRCSLCGQRLVEGDRERCSRVRCRDDRVVTSIGILCVFGGDGAVEQPVTPGIAIVDIAVVGTDFVE